MTLVLIKSKKWRNNLKRSEYIVNLSPVGLALIKHIWRGFVEGNGKDIEAMFMRKSQIEGQFDLIGENAQELECAICNSQIWVPIKPLIMFHRRATLEEAAQEERKLIQLWVSIMEMQQCIGGSRSNRGLPYSFLHSTLEGFINQWIKNTNILQDMESAGIIIFERDPILDVKWPVWNFKKEEELAQGIIGTSVQFDPQEVLFLLKRFFLELLPLPKNIRPIAWEVVDGCAIRVGKKEELLGLDAVHSDCSAIAALNQKETK